MSPAKKKTDEEVPIPLLDASQMTTVVDQVSSRIMGHNKYTYPSDEGAFESLDLHELTLRKKKLHRELGLINRAITLSKGGQSRFLPNKGTKKTNKSLGPRYRRRDTRANRR